MRSAPSFCGVGRENRARCGGRRTCRSGSVGRVAADGDAFAGCRSSGTTDRLLCARAELDGRRTLNTLMN